MITAAPSAKHNFAALPAPRSSRSVPFELMHRRLGHASKRAILALCQAHNVRITPGSVEEFHCRACHLAKAEAIISHTPAPPAQRLLAYVHWDFIPVQPPGLDGQKYLLHGVDACGGLSVQVLHFDNAPEFLVQRLRDAAAATGTDIRTTVAYAPKQNGRVKKAGHVLVRTARAMCLELGLPEALWPHYVATAVMLQNLLPRNSAPSPNTMIFSAIGVPYRIDIRAIKTWGCTAYVTIPAQRRIQSQKMATRALPEERRVVRARDVRFHEYDGKYTDAPEGIHGDVLFPDDEQPDRVPMAILAKPDPLPADKSTPETNEDDSDSSQTSGDAGELPVIGDRQELPLTPMSEDSCIVVATNDGTAINPDLQSILEEDASLPGAASPLATPRPLMADDNLPDRPRRQVPRRNYKDLHRGHIARSFASFAPDVTEPVPHVYALTALAAVELLQASPSIPRNWHEARRRDDYNTVYTMKEVPGQASEPKARWVVRGDQEEFDVLQDLYATVAPASSLRLFLTLAAIFNYELWQYNAVAAFLNAPAKAKVYVVQPQGLDNHSGRVCLLRRALYGLRAAPAWWSDVCREFLTKVSFLPIDAEQCLYRHKSGALLITYVDDFLLAAPTLVEIQRLASEINTLFELREIGEASSFLGIEIRRNRHTKHIYISQTKYLSKILAQWSSHSTINSAKTPWPAKLTIPPNWRDEEPVREAHSWLRQTGSLNFASCSTRPDITYTVQKLSEANIGPRECHLRIIYHLYRYLHHTLHYALRLGGCYDPSDLQLRVYADAAFGDDLATRYSTAGHVVFLGDGPIFWQSRRQTIVTLSSTEAEFINLTPSGLSVKWFARILRELNFPQPLPLVLFTDSQNALANVLNPRNPARTRHIDIRYKWVIQEAGCGNFNIRLVGTTDMRADGLTKPLLRHKHTQFLSQLSLIL
ncbi:retrovirus-related pol polyprotein [Cordyceps javanica]|uniref:Retrovirus-related pol polyprotein n=1 Tax=Cordyceps javanica TaxID=43265 RepID=A0A545UL69_9HYPO|nr:retrovirus-related pol polyprotein [Cordyceps javanica]TQW01659.1 retrovirus-related pol polyprotein [Cordyceps javanica]